jgi:hypothetical protein
MSLQFVGVCAVNLPVLVPFFKRATHLVSLSSRKSTKNTNNSNSNALPDSMRLSHVDRKGKKRTVHAITDVDNESEERIVGTKEDDDEMDLGRDQSREGGRSETSIRRGSENTTANPRGWLEEEEERGITVTKSYNVSTQIERV